MSLGTASAEQPAELATLDPGVLSAGPDAVLPALDKAALVALRHKLGGARNAAPAPSFGELPPPGPLGVALARM